MLSQRCVPAGSVLIETTWHSDSVPDYFFWKVNFEKKSADEYKSMQNTIMQNFNAQVFPNYFVWSFLDKFWSLYTIYNVTSGIACNYFSAIACGDLSRLQLTFANNADRESGLSY